MDRYLVVVGWTDGQVEYVIETSFGAFGAVEAAMHKFNADPDTGRLGETTSVTVVREGTS